jgi:hypothetical protein
MDILATTKTVIDTIDHKIKLIQVLHEGLSKPPAGSSLLSICESISVASYQIQQALLHHRDIAFIITSDDNNCSHTFHTTLEDCLSTLTALHKLLVKHQSLEADGEIIFFEALEDIPSITTITLSLTNISTSLGLLLQGLQL